MGPPNRIVRLGLLVWVLGRLAIPGQSAAEEGRLEIEGVGRWSPDGQRIVYPSRRDGNREIYVRKADGSGQTNLSQHPASEASPFWSPDGKKIAFSSTRDGGDHDIYVMNADGTEVTRLTDDLADDTKPIWSPSGNQIAFASNRDGLFDIFVMNADGRGQTNLTNDPAVDFSLAWSPDGSLLAFSSNRRGDIEIFVMDAFDDTGLVNLGNNPTTSDTKPAPSHDGPGTLDLHPANDPTSVEVPALRSVGLALLAGALLAVGFGVFTTRNRG